MATLPEALVADSKTCPHIQVKGHSCHFYDEKTIAALPWHEFEAGSVAKQILLPLVLEGSASFIANVKTKMVVATIAGQIIPLTINEKEYENSYIASNYYIVALIEEWGQKSPPFLRFLLKGMTAVLGGVLKGIKANKIVLINNWLFTSNICPTLNREETKVFLQELESHFPDHLFMWRNLESYQGEPLQEALKASGATLMATRMLFFFDPAWKEELSSKVHYHHRRDLRLIEKEGYTVVRNGDLTPADYERILELYRKVYMVKHTAYSPDFTAAFLAQALNHHTLNFIGLRKEGRLDGICALFAYRGKMISTLFGYETELPASSGLYRMMTILLLKEALDRNVVLNDGSGGAATKKYRGLRPFQERVALYHRHLPFGRRLFWKTMELFVNTIVHPFLKRFDTKE